MITNRYNKGAFCLARLFALGYIWRVDLPSPSEGHSAARQALDAVRSIEDPLEQLKVFEAALEKELGEWRQALKAVLGTVAGKDLAQGDRSTLLERQKDFAQRLNGVMDRVGVSLCVTDEPGVSFHLTVTPRKSGIGSFQFLGPSGHRRLGSITIPARSRLKIQITRKPLRKKRR
jgi:hypothetical protein